MVDSEQSLEIGEPGRKGLPAPFETRFQNIVNSAAEGRERPDPWMVYDKLCDILSELAIPEFEQVTPEQKAQAALATDVRQVKDAFLIDAYSYLDERHQGIISRRIHGFISSGTIELIRTKPFYSRAEETITLTERQKGILQRITTAASIPDNPSQLTYSFATILPPTQEVYGTIKR